MYFSLGLLYIAAVLENAGHKVRIADLRETEGCKGIPKADFYGITATTSMEITHAKKIAKHLKAQNDKNTVIIGGHHCTLFPKECAEHFDVVVVGDGEKAILDVIENNVRGIIVGEQLRELDSIPFPARHLLPEEGVFSNALFPGEKYGVGPKATTVISSRNCPFDCAFCPQVYIRRLYKYTIRFRDPECFVSEMKYLQDRFDCHHMRFVDDSFTINKRWMMEICERLEHLHIHYRTQTRSDLLDEEMCEALKRSGCDELGIGVESADDDVLRLINKRETSEDHKRAIKMIKDEGLVVKTNFMAGLPGETWKTIEANKQFIRETKPDKYILNMFCPFPGCDIERNPSKYGVKILNRDWSRYYNFTESFIETDVASNEELNAHFREFERFLKSEEWQ